MQISAPDADMERRGSRSWPEVLSLRSKDELPSISSSSLPSTLRHTHSPVTEQYHVSPEKSRSRRSTGSLAAPAVGRGVPSSSPEAGKLAPYVQRVSGFIQDPRDLGAHQHIRGHPGQRRLGRGRLLACVLRRVAVSHQSDGAVLGKVSCPVSTGRRDAEQQHGIQ